MTLEYHDYETAVYNRLLKKYQNDPSFCFSTRQKSTSAALRDYFIGTKTSNYFSTTFYVAPISYPGSSNDLINLIFVTRENKYFAFLTFNQTKNPGNKQNQLALDFIRTINQEFKNIGININYENGPEKKLEYFDVIIADKIADLDQFMDVVIREMERILLAIDGILTAFKQQNPDFEGYRIDKERFENIFQKRLSVRFKKYPATTPNLPNNPSEPEAVKPIELKHPLNQILFGPPGTGKTYSTIASAIAIAAPDFDLNTTRTSIKEKFKSLYNQKKIIFTTFHQSLGYEDFVEGIKPLKPEADGKVQYDIVDGIFKDIAQQAASNFENAKESNKGRLPFEEAFAMLQEELEETPDLKFPVKTKGYDYTIIGFTKTSIRFKKASGGTSHTLSIATLQKLYYGTRENDFKMGVAIYYPGLLSKLNSYQRQSEEAKAENFVLIIDEINRGNVSQIFGELITLLEEDKRMGKAESIEVILPYSKTTFSVPPNLYIIGTMNTADRSVEALDSALRRRFSFKELNPEPELLRTEKLLLAHLTEYEHEPWESPKWIKADTAFNELFGQEFNDDESKAAFIELTNKRLPSEQEVLDHYFFEGFDLFSVLEVINSRIELLTDYNHKIGHAYFLAVRSIADLMAVMYEKIIPLLQEYFYGDFGKIGLVLGSGFIHKPKTTGKNIFASFDYDLDILPEKETYQMIDYRTSQKSYLDEQKPEGIDFLDAMNLLINTIN